MFSAPEVHGKTVFHHRVQKSLSGNLSEIGEHIAQSNNYVYATTQILLSTVFL